MSHRWHKHTRMGFKGSGGSVVRSPDEGGRFVQLSRAWNLEASEAV